MPNLHCSMPIRLCSTGLTARGCLEDDACDLVTTKDLSGSYASKSFEHIFQDLLADSEVSTGDQVPTSSSEKTRTNHGGPRAKPEQLERGIPEMTPETRGGFRKMIRGVPRVWWPHPLYH